MAIASDGFAARSCCRIGIASSARPPTESSVDASACANSAFERIEGANLVKKSTLRCRLGTSAACASASQMSSSLARSWGMTRLNNSITEE